jgi:hypothetical protein
MGTQELADSAVKVRLDIEVWQSGSLTVPNMKYQIFLSFT